MERFFESEIDGELRVALRHGERVRASVLTVAADHVVLGVFGVRLTARSVLPLAVGDELELEVVHAGDRVELRPTSHRTNGPHRERRGLDLRG